MLKYARLSFGRCVKPSVVSLVNPANMNSPPVSNMAKSHDALTSFEAVYVVHECPLSGGLIMEQTPLSLQQHEILIVKAVEPLHVVVDIWRVLYRARYLSDNANPPTSPLHTGDQLIVTHVSPEAMTPVERLNRQGERDGCRYELSEYQVIPQQASPEKRRNIWP
jgi:hypothetical protein